MKDDTLTYYEQNAERYAADTLGADVSENRQRFLKRLPAHARILDLGCGSGRDAKYFLDCGYAVDAADGSAKMCEVASAYTGLAVKHIRFGELDAEAVYDGIWACASILHLPREELRDVLRRIAGALKKGGVFYTSFKYGDFEGMRNGRYFTYFTEESLKAFWAEASSLRLAETWISRDGRPERLREQWINLLAVRGEAAV